jgi:DNA polymerase-4
VPIDPAGDPDLRRPGCPGAQATILHVDMDAFYASVEVLEDPTLLGKPVIVGGAGRRGVVAAASYEARAYGVRSAMPSAQAHRLCPHAVFVSGNHDRYGDYSRRIHEIFGFYTPLVQGLALDEAFLDVTGARRLFGSSVEIGTAIRRRIAEEVGLAASVGVATTMFVAKLASEAAKPTASLSGVVPGPGVILVAPGDELAFLHPKPVAELWGVGPATAARLDRLGVATIGDLARVPRRSLEAAVGSAAGRHLHDLAWGRDERSVQPNRDVKSVGHEETYAHDRYEHADLRREVVRMSDAVATRLRGAELAGRTVTLKVRFGDFATITRSQTVTDPLNSGPTIAAVGLALLAAVEVAAGVRLLGVAVSGLSRGAGRQLSLDLDRGTPPPDGSGSGNEARWVEATDAVDQVRRRFGPGAVGPAALLGAGGLSLKQTGDQQWGPDE